MTSNDLIPRSTQPGIPTLVAFIMAVLTATGCTNVKEEVIIPAPPGDIWKVLIDAKGYPAWNTLLTPTEGSLQQGAYMTYRYTPPNDEPIDLRFKIETSERGRTLRQTGGTWGLFSFDHQWLLEATPEGTRVTQSESFAGIMVLFWDSEWLPTTYRAINSSLKKEVIRRQQPANTAP